MMMMASSAVIGPLGNYLVPLMIGSRRMAFPRVEAFSFWIFCAGYFVILTALPWAASPRAGPATPRCRPRPGGMDSYLVGFAVIGIGMILAGFNLAATIINYRAPGMTWGRLPIFVWSILATCALLTLATPTLVAAGLFGVLDRTAQTAFFVNEHGGSSFLWENLFWFFGHPEVYIMALPGFGIVAEIYRCSPANRCSATRWRPPACSAWPCCRSSSGSTTCSRAASTPTCGRCSCSPPS
jgi:cytochrome c oxidase subunit 1